MADFTILVIEDNATTSKLLRVTLEVEGFAVLEAATGKTAIEIMKRVKPDLVIQDFILPDMDGLELNRQLRALSKDSDLPILGLSGFLSRMQEIASADSGFTAFLIKPIEPSRLIEIIRSYLPASTTLAGHDIHGKNILIVDDDESQRKLLELNLKQAGFKVSHAENGVDAFQKIQETLPDAIISDILMPHMDGFQLCLKLRQDIKFCHIPVLFVSSHYLDENDQDLARKVGANGFVIRTSDYKVLIETLTQIFLKDIPAVFENHSLTALKEHHTHSLIRQLERQVLTNAELEKRNALQSAQLTLLRGVADALTTQKENIDVVFQNILSGYLDAAGISKGALYLKDSRDVWSLRQFVGYEESEREHLINFFGAQHLLTQAMFKRQIIMLPSDDVSAKAMEHFLRDARITTGLIIPLISVTECLGILFLGSKTTNVLNADPVAFAKTLGAQLGQTIALTMAFERLGMSERRYRMLMDSASCGILVLNEAGIILEVNKKAEELFGHSKDLMINNNYKNFLRVDDETPASVQIKKLICEKNIGPSEGHINQENGTTRDVEYFGDCVEIGGENLLLFIMNDVTERNRMRTQSLLNDKLSTMGTLAAGIVHEINNPVAWILANLNFLKEHMQALQDNIQNLKGITQGADININLLRATNFIEELKNQFLNFQEIVSDSIQGSEQVRDIVYNLKGFARTDSDSVNSSVDIHQILNTAIKIAAPEFKYRATLETDFAKDIPPLVSNKGKLHQVFLNLIINAAQAIPNDRQHNNILKIVTRMDQGRVRIDISDTGTGISPKNLAKIFEPFYTTKPSGIGTGLGLSICHQIIANLGGEIQVQSKVDEGSTFSVFLPVEGVAPLNLSLQQSSHARHARILVVDDEPSLLKTLQRILEKQHQVTTAGSGQAALELLNHDMNRFDIVVSDLNMPEVNGMDIYHFMEDKQPGSGQRIIFMTGGMDSPAIKEFIATVQNLYIDKPFRREELLRMIDKVMELSQ